MTVNEEDMLFFALKVQSHQIWYFILESINLNQYVNLCKTAYGFLICLFRCSLDN
jgi:hypothetical protein